MERERVGGGIRFTLADLRKRLLNKRLPRYDGPGRKYESICEDMSAKVHLGAPSCVSLCK